MTVVSDPKSASNPDRLMAVAEATRHGSRPGAAPVDLWNPPYCGEIGLRIAADGAWFYQGSPIGRLALVRLFASVLRKDADGGHYLVTPVEKIGIEVEDTPFLAVDMALHGEGQGQTLIFRTNLGDEVMADSQHPLRFARDAENDGVKPYVLVRGRLEARLTRALAYELVEGAMTHCEDDDRLGVWSGGAFFPIAGEMS